MRCSRQLAVCLLGTIALAGVSAADGAVVVYNNTTTNTGYTTAPGGATGTGSTNLLADDITPIAGYAGQPVTQLSFGLVDNGLAGAVTPTVYIYDNNGSGGGPGTLVSSITLAPVALVNNVFTPVTATSVTGLFNLPSGTFWAGVAVSSASATISNSVGQESFNPPTVGSSQDEVFYSANPASASDDPDGATTNFNGLATANLYWQFSVTPVPEPTCALLMGVAGTLLLRRRRQQG